MKECSQLLKKWLPNAEDETDLELHVELWTKLANLCMNDESLRMSKLALFCAENALRYAEDDDQNNSLNVSIVRLRWYSIADFLYSRAISRIIEIEGLEKSTKEDLYLNSLKHALEATKRGYLSQETKMVRDGAKLFQHIISTICKSECRQEISLHFAKAIYSLIFYLKITKENSQDGFRQEDAPIISEVVLELLFTLIQRKLVNYQIVNLLKIGRLLSRHVRCR